MLGKISQLTFYKIMTILSRGKLTAPNHEVNSFSVKVTFYLSIRKQSDFLFKHTETISY